MLERLSTPHLLVIWRLAKHPTRGLRPFFADPYAMINLRLELYRRGAMELMQHP